MRGLVLGLCMYVPIHYMCMQCGGEGGKSE